MNRFEFLLSWTIIPIMIVLGLFCQQIVSFVNLHLMKVSTENDNNFGYEKITIVVDNIPLKMRHSTGEMLCASSFNILFLKWRFEIKVNIMTPKQNL